MVMSINQSFDNANSKITDELAGRTVKLVYREGLELVICTTCGHEVRLAATVGHHIVHKKTDVRVILGGVSIDAGAGNLG